jgi:thiamine monophosphate synthase
MHAGADGIAAIGCFHKAKDPFLAAQNLITILKEAKNDR